MNRSEMVSALQRADFSPIYQKADAICREVFGSDVYIRAIIEFSNYCKRTCTYCGLNATNRNLPRFRMQPEEIVETACAAWQAGYQTVVLQSGEDGYYTPKLLCQITQRIKEKTDLKITLSCGEFSQEDYSTFKASGADRYLLKHETSDPEIYRALHPDSSLEQRVNCLKAIKKAGLETGSGFMIGLPGQTEATIADDVLLLKELQCDMAGIGPFIPHPETPLKDQPHGSTTLAKRAVALARIIMPRLNLPATTSLGILDGTDVFSCGANVIMKKVTPPKYRSMYEIYPVQNKQYQDIQTERAEVEQLIQSLGRRPV